MQFEPNFCVSFSVSILPLIDANSFRLRTRRFHQVYLVNECRRATIMFQIADMFMFSIDQLCPKH